MYCFFISEASVKSKKLQYTTLILSAALSGLESYNLFDSDIRVLECVVLRKLRAMLVGRASEWSHTYDTKVQWTNAQVWKFWDVVPVAVELALRRI
jgi:hypothetical protein